MAKVVEYLKYHEEHECSEIRIPLTGDNLQDCGATRWDSSFVNVDRELLFDLTVAASYLDIASLWILLSAKSALLTNNKSSEKLRKEWGVYHVYLKLKKFYSFPKDRLPNFGTKILPRNSPISQEFQMLSDFPASEEAELRRDYCASRKSMGAVLDSDLSQLAASSVVRSSVRAAEYKVGLKQLTDPWCEVQSFGRTGSDGSEMFQKRFRKSRLSW